ncbi:alpha/beta hydrolase family protein [Myroides sp. LJL119]
MNALSSDGEWLFIHKKDQFNITKDSTYLVNTNNSNQKITKLGKKNAFFENHSISYDKSSKILNIFNLKTRLNINLENISSKNLYFITNESLILLQDDTFNSFKLLKITKDNTIYTVWEKPINQTSLLDLNEEMSILIYQSKNPQKNLEIIDLKSLNINKKNKINYIISSVLWDKNFPVAFLNPTGKNNRKIPFLTFLNYEKNTQALIKLDSIYSYNNIEAISPTSFKLTKTYISTQKDYNVNELGIWSTNNRKVSQINFESDSSNIYNSLTNIYETNPLKIYEIDILKDQSSLALGNGLIIFYDNHQYYDYTNLYSARKRDISIYNPSTNKVNTIVKAQPDPLNTTSLSTFGNYFVYYTSNKVIIYNVIKEKIEAEYAYKKINFDPYKIFKDQIRYWTIDERFFIFSVNSKLIKYDTLLQTFITIKESKKDNLRFKIENKTIRHIGFHQLHSRVLKNAETLIVHEFNMTNNTFSLYKLQSNEQENILFNTKDRIYDIYHSEDYNTIIYTSENFNIPPSIYKNKNGANKKVGSSYFPEEIYNWKKQKDINFKDKYSNNLKGTLFYPENFNSDEKYPLIVHIYQFQQHLANTFTYPKFQDGGFNVDTFLKNGYFVFFPDILDSKDGTGLSALNCVEESLKTVLKQEKSIDKLSLGIYGISHGGYEVNFIITQTNLFKAAVSGNANVDLVRSYFSFNNDFSSPFLFQFENGQYNMGAFFSNKEKFLSNSPILYLDKIDTPLLSFTGKRDQNIDWEQTKELFIGMLRYKKPHISLVYKNEGHGIQNIENRKDLTKRILNWYDHFLKGKHHDWIIQFTEFDKNRMTPN